MYSRCGGSGGGLLSAVSRLLPGWPQLYRIQTKDPNIGSYLWIQGIGGAAITATGTACDGRGHPVQVADRVHRPTSQGVGLCYSWGARPRSDRRLRTLRKMVGTRPEERDVTTPVLLAGRMPGQPSRPHRGSSTAGNGCTRPSATAPRSRLSQNSRPRPHCMINYPRHCLRSLTQRSK